MDKDQSKTKPAEAAEKDADNSRSTPPRGNQEADRESVDKGQDQMHKISGN